MNLAELPEEVKERAEDIKEDNPDLTESQAIAIARDQLNLADECPDGKAKVGDECIDIPDTDTTPPSLLNSSPAIMAADNLDTEPIERVEESDNTVRYKSLRLLTEGVWTDQKSKTPTLYSEEGIAEIEAQYSEEYNGPPVNVMHDVDPQEGTVNEASHGGYVDPNSLAFHGGALMGDVVLDTSTSAGAFADENLQSALESNGRVGFGGPSVELDLDPQEHIENSEHPKAEKEINGGYLTGLGLVMNPADKNIDFAKETRERAVAMSGQEDKALYTQTGSMEDDNTAKILEAIATRELQLGDIQDDAQNIADELEVPVDEVMEVLDPLLDPEEDDEGGEEEEEEEEEPEMEEDEDEEDEDDEPEMEEGMGALKDRLSEVESELEALKGQMIEEEEMSEELSSIRDELADAETVSELKDAKDDLDKRLSEIEEEPQINTLADGQDSDEWEWSAAEGQVESDTTGL